MYSACAPSSLRTTASNLFSFLGCQDIKVHLAFYSKILFANNYGLYYVVQNIIATTLRFILSLSLCLYLNICHLCFYLKCLKISQSGVHLMLSSLYFRLYSVKTDCWCTVCAVAGVYRDIVSCKMKSICQQLSTLFLCVMSHMLINKNVY